MNAIAEFFQRHHAVRTNREGRPDWRTAKDETLLAWARDTARQLFRDRDTSADDFNAMLPYYKDVEKELLRRFSLPAASEALRQGVYDLMCKGFISGVDYLDALCRRARLS